MQNDPRDQPEATPTVRAPRRSGRRMLLWGGLSATVAVGLLIALAVQVVAGHPDLLGGRVRQAATPTALPTPTAMPTPQPLAAVAPTRAVAGKPLTRQNHPIPANLFAAVYGPDPSYPGVREAHDMLAFAPTDSRTGYLCANVTTSSILTIWATHDGATTWTHVSDLPFVPQPATNIAGMPSVRPSCTITVDATDPLRLDVFSAWAPTSYLSDDGGKTWRSLGAHLQLADLSAHGAVSVALQLRQDDSTPLHLIASDDDWRTWRAIDHPFLTQGMSPAQVWQRPGDGALLVETQAQDPTEPSNDVSAHIYVLWESVDAGAHWTQFPLPPNVLRAASPFIAQPYGNAPWQVCGIATGEGASATSPEFLGCTRDGGRTWASRPLPIVTVVGGSGAYPRYPPASGLPLSGLQNARLLNDGTLVSPLVVQLGVDTSNSDLFALAPGASVWRDLGPAPGGNHLELPRVYQPEALLYDTQPKPIWIGPGPLTFESLVPNPVPEDWGLQIATLS